VSGSKIPEVRHLVVQVLEDMVCRLNPDTAEAQALLDALTVSLGRRYGREALSDVLYEAKQMREALDELERTTPPSEEDEAYELWRARLDA
jgi:DNA-binding transcriptional regulator YbjK